MVLYFSRAQRQERVFREERAGCEQSGQIFDIISL